MRVRQKHDALLLPYMSICIHIDVCAFFYLSCLHIGDFDLFPWQARRDLNDPENAIIGAFAGNMTFKICYISYAHHWNPIRFFQHFWNI